MVSETDQRVLHSGRFPTVEANQSDIWGDALQHCEVVRFLLRDVLVHAAATEASVISVPESDAMNF